MIIKTFIVEGMTCKNCVAHIERGIKDIPGVEEVITDLLNGQVRISGEEIKNSKVQKSVEESGYVFKGEIKDAAIGSDIWFS